MGVTVEHAHFEECNFCWPRLGDCRACEGRGMLRIDEGTLRLERWLADLTTKGLD